MTPEELSALVTQPEHALLERKSAAVNRQEIRQTLVAFANSVPDGQEAVLFIGIRDDGTIQGTETADETQRLVRLVATTDCYPPITVYPTVIQVDSLSVVAVVVPNSRNRPHFSGPAYVRVGAESVVASTEQYEELITSRHETCRVLQTWKGAITVWENNVQLDHPGQTFANYRRRRDGLIIACTPHLLRLQDCGSHTEYAVALRQVEIGYDVARNRNAITIHP